MDALTTGTAPALPEIRLTLARPLARLIQDAIKKPLADELLFGRLAGGGAVRVRVADGRPVFDLPPTDP